MNLVWLLQALTRVIVFLALALLGIAGIELFANLLGASLFQNRYGAGRLIELAGVLMIFVLSAQLRQIHDALKSSRG